MIKKWVLFVCLHNTARSQMAEAYLKHLAADRFLVESAGMKPGILNPLVVEVMKEAGIDISRSRPRSVSQLSEQGKTYDYVISVCDEAHGESCPHFPGMNVKRLNWSFEDPSLLKGPKKEKLKIIRSIRDQIKSKIEEFIKTV